MSIELNGTTGITTPDLTSTDDITANSSAVLTSVSLPTALNATGSAPIYACRAWVNFNGTGDVAIRAAGNVSTITDNGPGDYTVNFTTAMVDANYSFTMGYVPDAIYASAAYARQFQAQTISDSSIRVRALVQDGSGGSTLDYPYLSVSIFR